MPQPKARYRVICYELRDSRETLIMDSTDDAFIAATGKLDGEISHAGPHPAPSRARAHDRQRPPTTRPTPNSAQNAALNQYFFSGGIVLSPGCSRLTANLRLWG